MNFSSLAALQVIILTTSNTAFDGQLQTVLTNKSILQLLFQYLYIYITKEFYFIAYDISFDVQCLQTTIQTWHNLPSILILFRAGIGDISYDKDNHMLCTPFEKVSFENKWQQANTWANIDPDIGHYKFLDQSDTWHWLD